MQSHCPAVEQVREASQSQDGSTHKYLPCLSTGPAVTQFHAAMTSMLKRDSIISLTYTPYRRRQWFHQHWRTPKEKAGMPLNFKDHYTAHHKDQTPNQKANFLTQPSIPTSHHCDKRQITEIRLLLSTIPASNRTQLCGPGQLLNHVFCTRCSCSHYWHAV